MIRDFGIVWGERDLLLSGLANTTVLSVALRRSRRWCSASLLTAAADVAARARSRWPARGFVDGMRCMPFLLFAYIVYYGLPSLGLDLDNWNAGLAALIDLQHRLHGGDPARRLGGAAARADRRRHRLRLSGLRQLFRRIILPPLLLSAAPVIGNQVIQIIKDSAFLTVIALPELTHAASSIQSRHYVPFAAFITAVLLYWGLCLIVEAGVALDRPPRRGAAMTATGHRRPKGRADVARRLQGVRLARGAGRHQLPGRQAARRSACSARPARASRRCCAVSTGWSGPTPDRSISTASAVGVTAAGVVMNDRDLSRMRTRIGMVFQHFALWPHLTVLQNITEAPIQVQTAPEGRGARRGAGAARQGRARRQARRVSGAPLGRAEAARRHRARARDAPGRCCCSTSRPARSIPSWSARCWW